MKLSVAVITFEEVEYVREALEGVLRQQTTFPFEVIVGDDASTDGTRDVLEDLCANSAGQMKLLLADSNYGDCGHSNFLSTLDAAQGEYIAFLDGDDVWTAPDKLQRQVDFLDTHPECALCVHRVEHFSEDGFRQLSPRPGRADTYDVGALLIDNFAARSATVVRRSAVDGVPEWYRTIRLACDDWVFAVLTARNGRVGFIDDVMGKHRLHSAGLTNRYGAIRLLSDKVAAFTVLRPYLPHCEKSLARAERRVRWKLRIARLGPRTYRFIQRLFARLDFSRRAGMTWKRRCKSLPR